MAKIKEPLLSIITDDHSELWH